MNIYKTIIEKAWEDRSLLSHDETIDTIKFLIGELDEGRIRIAEKVDGNWVVNEWLKKAVLLSILSC